MVKRAIEVCKGKGARKIRLGIRVEKALHRSGGQLIRPTGYLGSCRFVPSFHLPLRNQPSWLQDTRPWQLLMLCCWTVTCVFPPSHSVSIKQQEKWHACYEETLLIREALSDIAQLRRPRTRPSDPESGNTGPCQACRRYGK